MRKWVRIALVVLLITLFSAIAGQALRSREPRCQGRSLTSWLEDCDEREVELKPEAREAVRQMGTNALPVLLNLFAAEDGAFKEKALALANRTPFVSLMSAEEANGRAYWGFKALGPIAESAIPSLATFLLNPKRPYDTYRAADALAFLGPKAVPLLVQALTNADPEVRVGAASALRLCQFETHLVVLSLTKSLNDKEDRVRDLAAAALEDIGEEPELAVPALAKVVTTDNYKMARLHAFWALHRFGNRAKAAVPALQAALRDGDAEIRESAAEALKEIDPAAATRAGVE